jgi:hypothetical protein
MLARWAKAAEVLLLAACAAASQDLDPQDTLLSRIKGHLREELEHVPNYTCLETISRFQGERRPGAHSNQPLAKLDTVQLEIVYTDGREWYGSPGARQLSVDDPVAFTGGGMIATGAFGITMNNLVEISMLTYRGDDPVAGRRAVRYDFRIPALARPDRITLNGETGIVGEEGSVWVDPESLDLIRVESHAIEIPPDLPLEESTMTVEYARMRIAGTDALLAQSADSRLVDASGNDSYNRIEFTHCHSYSASSEITFDTRPAPAAESAPAAPVLGAAVQPFLEVTILLATPVSDKDFVGSLIEGKISGDVIRKGTVVIPDGSVVLGRIRALDHYPDFGAFAVGLEFTDVEVRGESMPFYADFLRVDKDPRIVTRLSRDIFLRGKDAARRATNVIPQPELPGVASFFVKGADFTLPAGFRTVWRTRALIR